MQVQQHQVVALRLDPLESKSCSLVRDAGHARNQHDDVDIISSLQALLEALSARDLAKSDFAGRDWEA